MSGGGWDGKSWQKRSSFSHGCLGDGLPATGFDIYEWPLDFSVLMEAKSPISLLEKWGLVHRPRRTFQPPVARKMIQFAHQISYQFSSISIQII
jgi:hypothetical protein